MLNEHTLARLEKENPEGFTSVKILEIFAEHGICLSEASLRKYVQQGLLPRSVRVGKKGKHRGSQGVYPTGVVRQILQLRSLMAQDLTIEQIRHEFLFMRGELEQVARALEGVFRKIDGVLRERTTGTASRAVVRLVDDARSLGQELRERLFAIERHLTASRSVGRVVAS
jgi:hypothetical protein